MSNNLRNKLNNIEAKHTELKEIMNQTLTDFEVTLLYQVSQVVKLLREHIEDCLTKDDQILEANKEIEDMNRLEEHLEQIRQCLLEFTTIAQQSFHSKASTSTSNHTHQHHQQQQQHHILLMKSHTPETETTHANSNQSGNEMVDGFE